MRLTRVKIVGAAAAVAVVAGGGAALAVNRSAADSPRTERDAFLTDVAGRLGVSLDDLKQAFREAAQARGLRGGGPFFGPRHGPGPRHAHEAFEAAGSYLGLSRSELMSRLFDGQSLAQIAEDEGKSVDGLKAAIRSAMVERLDAAVADGRLTEARKQRLLDRLDAIIDDLVERARGPHGLRGAHT
jgi:hypothetical protein